MHSRQSEQFDILADVLSPAQVLEAATAAAARLLRMDGQIGCIAVGRHADMIAVDGGPLTDPRILARPVETLRMVMKSGRIVKSSLP